MTETKPDQIFTNLEALTATARRLAHGAQIDSVELGRTVLEVTECLAFLTHFVSEHAAYTVRRCSDAECELHDSPRFDS